MKTVLDGQFTKQSMIGSGTFGNVYRATHMQTGQIFALKQFKTKFLSRDKAFE